MPRSPVTAVAARGLAPDDSAATLGPGTLAALLGRYPALGEPLSCRPLTEGLLNRGYRLTTTRGRYFLKHHLDGDQAAIARQHRATLRLAGLGVPVAPPVAAADGNTVTVVGGRCYALHPWIDGTHRDGGDLTGPQSRRLGRLLGVVHVCLDRVMRAEPTPHPATPAPPAAPAPETVPARAPERAPSWAALPPSRPEPFAPRLLPGPRSASPSPTPLPCDPAHAAHAAHVSPGPTPSPAPWMGAPPGSPVAADPAETFALIDDLLALARRRRPRDAFDELAEHRLIERRALIERHAHRRPTPATTPASGWVHGDFHPLNLLYRGTEPAAIVDWDRLGVQPRAEEAVRAAAIFFVRPGGTLALAKVRPYARGYRAATGASPQELAAAVHRVWWERLNDFWILRWRYQRGDHRADPQFPAVAALAVWWTSRYEAVRAAFCE
ncbi:phosphotransferase [Streptomyces buecherae]|uniref:phosphotransferase n=2 Tax=Streptomyces buecherae TaxID=2763006 RepID=UPI003555E7A6